MSRIVIYVQDVNLGVPAHGISVRLERPGPDGSWLTMARGVTDVNGCIEDFITASNDVGPGLYRLVYETAQYFENQGVVPLFRSFALEFSISGNAELVMPLLLSPFSYTLYRGS